MISLLKSTFSSADARVLLIAAERAILYLFSGGEISKAYIFSADQGGLQAFDRALGELEPAPLEILVDVVEEEYRTDTIPHVRGADRRAVLERKFARLFRGTPYHHALAQGRDTSERRDDRVLLTAITRAETLSPWLEALDRHKVPVAGICSLPILSERLLKRIDAKGANVLLITLQKASGLRQSFFRDGHLKISRLAHMPRLGSVPFAAHLIGEVEKLRRYLNSLALIARDGPLHIYILSHGQLLSELEQHCRDSDQEKFFLLDADDVARRLGLKQTGESHYADLLFAHLVAGSLPLNHYARPQETQFYAIHRLRIGLAVAGLMLLLASAGWSGFNFIEGVMFKEQALDAAQKATFYQQRFEIARGKLPATPVEPREIKTAVDLVQSLREHKSSPEPIMRLLGHALDSMPEVQLDQLNWQSSLNGAAESQVPDAAQVFVPSGANAGDYAYFEAAELRGHLTSFDGDYGAAIATIDALARAIQAQPEITSVEVQQYPLDVRSDASVSGSATAAVEASRAAFKLRLVRGVSRGRQEG